MSAAVAVTVADLLAMSGAQLGPTEDVTVDARRIDTFKRVSAGDRRTSPQSADAIVGPHRQPIAHAYLMVALAGRFVPELLHVPAASAVVNYGVERVRFLAAAPPGSVLRARGRLVAADPIAHGVQVTLDLVVELAEGRPACEVRSVLRYLE